MTKRRIFLKELSEVKLGVRREHFYIDEELAEDLDMKMRQFEQKIIEYENEI